MQTKMRLSIAFLSVIHRKITERLSLSFVRLLSLLLIILSVSAHCGKTSCEEIMRKTSPDYVADAVVMRINTDATVSDVYEIYLVPTGEKFKEGHELFRADNIDDLEIRWKKAKLLEIQYSKARIFHFSNFWQSQNVENFRYIVELRLTKIEK